MAVDDSFACDDDTVAHYLKDGYSSPRDGVILFTATILLSVGLNQFQNSLFVEWNFYGAIRVKEIGYLQQRFNSYSFGDQGHIRAGLRASRPQWRDCRTSFNRLLDLHPVF